MWGIMVPKGPKSSTSSNFGLGYSSNVTVGYSLGVSVLRYFKPEGL